MFVMLIDELFQGCENVFYSYRAVVQAGRVGICCATASVRMLCIELVKMNTYQIFSTHYITHVI
jgi:hypothetical protein